MINIINFPARTGNEPDTAVNSFFTDSTRLNSFIALPFVTRLSDHTSQYVILQNVFVKKDLYTKSYRIACINNDSISTINNILLN